MADNRVVGKAGRPLVLNHGVTVADWTAQQVADGQKPPHHPFTVRAGSWQQVGGQKQPEGQQE